MKRREYYRARERGWSVAGLLAGIGEYEILSLAARITEERGGAMCISEMHGILRSWTEEYGNTYRVGTACTRRIDTAFGTSAGLAHHEMQAKLMSADPF